MKDREFVANLIDRAKAAKCSALVLTLDLQILGQRHKDLRNGLSAPPKWTVHHGIQLATKPFWCLDMLRTKRRGFDNIVGHAQKDRKSVVAGKGVSVRVEFGGRRTLKKKKKQKS